MRYDALAGTLQQHVDKLIGLREFCLDRAAEREQEGKHDAAELCLMRAVEFDQAVREYSAQL